MFREAAEHEAEEQEGNDGHQDEAAGGTVLAVGKACDEGVRPAQQRLEQRFHVGLIRQRGFQWRRLWGGCGLWNHGGGGVWWLDWMAFAMGMARASTIRHSAGTAKPPVM